jgi:hypothetical protein
MCGNMDESHRSDMGGKKLGMGKYVLWDCFPMKLKDNFNLWHKSQKRIAGKRGRILE